MPYIAYSPKNLKRDSKLDAIFADQAKWLVTANEVFDANKQIEFINNGLKTDVKIKFSFVSILMKNLIGFTIIALLFQAVKAIYSILMDQRVWFMVAISLFFVCTGGFVYSALNNMPLFKFERNEYGSIQVGEYIMRGQRGQYAGEGYIGSFLFTIIGLAYLYLSKVNETVEGRHNQRIAVIVGLIVLHILQKCLMVVYRFKSPWYNPTFLPPSYYTRGSLAMDQGNTV